MRPILLKGHTRPLTQIRYNSDGDLLFSVAKDHTVNAWFSHNGERLGTYKGHVGAVWSVDVDGKSVLLATGSADNSIKIWDVKSGKCLHTWDFPTAIKRVEFSGDDRRLLSVVEQRMGHPGSVEIFNVGEFDGVTLDTAEMDGPALEITTRDSKATVAGWSFLDKLIIMGHENGSVSQTDSKTGELLQTVQTHDQGYSITDIQFSPDRTYFVTSSKDKSAIISDANSLQVLKRFVADAPLNTAAITPVKDFVVLGGGQDASDVTTTLARQGKFEARFFHKIFGDEVGRVKGHFGPLNSIAVHPDGSGYSSGAEDGYVRIHHFEKAYFDFMYDVERDEAY